jgi:hypothetical protein
LQLQFPRVRIALRATTPAMLWAFTFRKYSNSPMERDTTIPSILGPANGPARNPKSSSGSGVLRFAYWGLVLAIAVGIYRFFGR